MFFSVYVEADHQYPGVHILFQDPCPQFLNNEINDFVESEIIGQ